MSLTGQFFDSATTLGSEAGGRQAMSPTGKFFDSATTLGGEAGGGR